MFQRRPRKPAGYVVVVRFRRLQAFCERPDPEDDLGNPPTSRFFWWLNLDGIMGIEGTPPQEIRP